MHTGRTKILWRNWESGQASFSSCRTIAVCLKAKDLFWNEGRLTSFRPGISSRRTQASLAVSVGNASNHLGSGMAKSMAVDLLCSVDIHFDLDNIISAT